MSDLRTPRKELPKRIQLRQSRYRKTRPKLFLFTIAIGGFAAAIAIYVLGFGLLSLMVGFIVAMIVYLIVSR